MKNRILIKLSKNKKYIKTMYGVYRKRYMLQLKQRKKTQILNICMYICMYCNIYIYVRVYILIKKTSSQ